MDLSTCSGFWDHLSSSATGRGQVKDKHGCLAAPRQLKLPVIARARPSAASSAPLASGPTV